MNFINKKLNNLYILPNSYGFKLLSYLNNTKRMIFATIFSLLIGYQTITIVNTSLQKREIITEITTTKPQVSQLKISYTEQINKNKELISQEHNITYINETIQKIIQKNGVNISKLDWHLEQDRSVDLTIINTSNAIFNVISDLNKLPYLKFNTLILTKSEQSRQLELNATLVLIEHKE
ncbi:hypothetical protein PTQ27_11355 [Mannheimia sp. AT1]|uniref:Uncharacterized protein n=1 Tax=Mannheimia cairinae TaxID=3025936 RepID=A0ABT5MSM5_9PAST|nr:hypothetical protein [Mannheimia cairinae]MDD0825050.1 hypothetical protein [Mannheimia cairinae]MDD0825695.1 hypothetical protein [Mannheimia cairinae]